MKQIKQRCAPGDDSRSLSLRLTSAVTDTSESAPSLLGAGESPAQLGEKNTSQHMEDLATGKSEEL
eukprot:1423357-Rhodomonas_salina.1